MDGAWVNRRPGLPEASRAWLADLDRLLALAERRSRRMLRAEPINISGSVVRLARLAGDAAPRLAPALVDRDGPAIVTALAQTALRGGPTYVKFGQLVSSTRGLVPDWVADAFAGCRDAVPPAPASAIAATLSRSGLDRHLRSWDPEPLASASVAQVHRATLEDGSDVVVKVRRPGIVRLVAADAAYLLPALQFIEARDERLRMANLRGSLELMLRLFAQEVDLRLEAASIVEMAQAFERAGMDVQVPAPIPGLVAKRALVMEYVEGVSAAEPGLMEDHGHVAADLVRLAIAGVLETTMVDGIFHGDLHLGNVLVNQRGLALIDYGIVGRLTPVQRRSLIALMMAGFQEDRPGIVEALKGFGALPADLDTAAFLGLMPDPPTPAERRQMMTDRRALEERITLVVRTLSASGFRVVPELTLFVKNFVYLNDAVLRHAPDFDIEAEIGEILLRLMARLSDAS